MSVVVIGLNHRTAPVDLRERFAVPEPAIPQALDALRAACAADEGVIVSTCNRVEIYAATSIAGPEACARLTRFLAEFRQCPEPAPQERYAWSEPHSLEHLFRVAAGLDSMVLGETEVLGQLKKAYDIALKHRFTGPRLNRAFQRAFQMAKQIRTATSIQRGSVSVASVAVELAEKIFESLDQRQVMVIGAGETSEKTARALLSRGARSILVANRSCERAAQLASELGGRAVRFEDWGGEFRHTDIIISSTAAPHYVLDRKRLAPLLAARSGKPLLLIDIAVPRDIDPDVNFLNDVYLYNIDDLQAIATDYLQQRQEEVARCETMIRDGVQALLCRGDYAGVAHRHCDGQLALDPPR
jgi:glutamyl-tRNA reductase